MDANDELMAFEVVPLIVALIVPITVTSLSNVAGPVTFRDPDIIGSKIFI